MKGRSDSTPFPLPGSGALLHLCLCVTDAHTYGPKVQWVLQCRLAQRLSDPLNVINVSSLLASTLQSPPSVCPLASVNSLPAPSLFGVCFPLFLLLPFSLVMLPAAHLLRKHVVVMQCRCHISAALIRCRRTRTCRRSVYTFIVPLPSDHVLSFRATGWMSRGAPSLPRSRYE